MNLNISIKTLAIAGFVVGIGFLAAQEIWWVLSGLSGVCHG